MSIQDLGAIGEILGGIAVLVTLIYLAIQTRTNTKALRAQTHQQIAESRRNNLFLFFEYPDLYQAVIKAHTKQDLTDHELSLLRHFTVIAARHHENELFQFSQGMIDPDEMESQRKVMLLPHIQFGEIERAASLHTPAMQEEILLLRARRNEGDKNDA